MHVMTRKANEIRRLLAVLLLASALPAAANSPAAMDPRYELLHEGTEVLDKRTGLVWRRCIEGQVLQEGRCAGKPVSRFSGALVEKLPERETPWRLPTADELLSIVLFPYREYKRQVVVDEVAFPDTPRARFEVTGARHSSAALYVHFSNGEVQESRPLDAYYRAVRFAPDAGERTAARGFARVQASMDKRDHLGYCDAHYLSRDYRDTLMRSCRQGIKDDLQRERECGLHSIQVQAGSERVKCQNMGPAEFAATVARQEKARASFLREAAARGFDGEALIAEQLAFLPVPAPLPPMDARYELLHGGTEVLDRITNLIWQRCPDGMRLKDERCIRSLDGRPHEYVERLPARESAWRIPSTDELLGLVLFPAEKFATRAKVVVDARAFPDTPQERFEASGASGGAFPYVYFGTGEVRVHRPLGGYRRAVRDGPGKIAQ